MGRYGEACGTRKPAYHGKGVSEGPGASHTFREGRWEGGCGRRKSGQGQTWCMRGPPCVGGSPVTGAEMEARDCLVLGPTWRHAASGAPLGGETALLQPPATTGKLVNG